MPEAAPASTESSPGTDRLTDPKLLWLVWSLPGLLHALQLRIFESDSGSLLGLLVYGVPLWWPWIPATLLVWRLATRLPLSDEIEPAVALDPDAPEFREPGPLSWAIHGVAALALSSLHMVLILFWARLTAPVPTIELSVDGFLLALSAPVFMLSLSSYLLVLGAHYVSALATRLHERNLQEARLLGRLAEAEIRSLRMQLRPEALAESFENISAQVRAGEFDAAESAISRLARDLRETLRHGDNLPEVWSNPDLERRSRVRRAP